jgi:hypothetical protein
MTPRTSYFDNAHEAATHISSRPYLQATTFGFTQASCSTFLVYTCFCSGTS